MPLNVSFLAHIHPNARWKQNGLTIAGGNGHGNGINQLSDPWGLYVDDDQNVYVADTSNHRIMKWKSGATSGQVVAGGNQQGSGAHQLSNPYDVIIDKERDSLIICDNSNSKSDSMALSKWNKWRNHHLQHRLCGFDNGREWISLYR